MNTPLGHTPLILESKHFEPVDRHFDAKEGRSCGHGVSLIYLLFDSWYASKRLIQLLGVCTDTSLSAREALSLYVRRWAVGIDYL